MEDEQETIESLKASVVALRDKELPALREQHATELKALTDAHAGRVGELESGKAASDQALAAAQAELEALKAEASRVPGGGVVRVPVDTSAMTAGEKIRHGLAQRGG